MARRIIASTILIALSFTAPSFADSTVTVRTTGGLKKALQSAKPGETILVAPGTYAGGLWMAGVHGTKDHPILVAAENPKDKPVFRGGKEVLKIASPMYLELRDLAFEHSKENILNFDDKGPGGTSKGLVLRGLELRGAGQGNEDGIKLSGVDDFQIIGCSLSDWGNGGSAIDMVGCHNGLIEDCGFTQGSVKAVTGIQTKGGSANITIRRCRFDKAGARAINVGGWTDLRAFRPAIPAKDAYEAKDILIEGCTFRGSEAPIAFVNIDGAEARYNTFYHPGKWVFRILQESRTEEFLACRNGNFHHNIVVFGDKLESTINIGKLTAPETFKFANNWWYCDDAPGMSGPTLPTAETDAVIGKDPLLVDPKNGDFSVKAESGAKDVGAHALPSSK